MYFQCEHCNRYTSQPVNATDATGSELGRLLDNFGLSSFMRFQVGTDAQISSAFCQFRSTCTQSPLPHQDVWSKPTDTFCWTLVIFQASHAIPGNNYLSAFPIVPDLRHCALLGNTTSLDTHGIHMCIKFLESGSMILQSLFASNSDELFVITVFHKSSLKAWHKFSTTYY